MQTHDGYHSRLCTSHPLIPSEKVLYSPPAPATISLFFCDSSNPPNSKLNILEIYKYMF